MCGLTFLVIDFEILHIMILLFKHGTLFSSSEKPKWRKMMVNHYQTIPQPIKLGHGLKNQHQLYQLFEQLHHLSNIDILVYKYLRLRNSVSTCVKMKKWTFFWCMQYSQFFDKRASHTASCCSKAYVTLCLFSDMLHNCIKFTYNHIR